MIDAELKLRFSRNAHVVIMPNMTAGEPPVIDGLDNLKDAVPFFRPLEALRIGDVLEDCELLDRVTGDRINLPAGITWRFNRLDVEPLADNRPPKRVFTLVRVT